jgi:hypothetical protein
MRRVAEPESFAMKPSISKRKFWRCLQVYIIAWLLSCIVIHPELLSATLDNSRHDLRYPVKLSRCICIAPAIFIVDWEEGEGPLNSEGWQGLMLYTPWTVHLLKKRMSWIS